MKTRSRVWGAVCSAPAMEKEHTTSVLILRQTIGSLTCGTELSQRSCPDHPEGDWFGRPWQNAPKLFVACEKQTGRKTDKAI